MRGTGRRSAASRTHGRGVIRPHSGRTGCLYSGAIVPRVSKVDPRSPAVLPPVGQLRTTDRIRVGLEVITNYPAMWRAVRTNDLAHMVATARTTSHRVVTPPEQHAEMAERVGGIVQSAMKVLPTDKRCLVTSLLTLRVLANRSIP